MYLSHLLFMTFNTKLLLTYEINNNQVNKKFSLYNK